MEVIKRKIWLEEGISREPDFTWGEFTANTFYMKVFLTQDVDNMGIFTDVSYINDVVNYSKLIDKLNTSGYTFPFMTGATASITLSPDDVCARPVGVTVNDYFVKGDTISGATESKLEEVKSYDRNNPYIIGFDIDEETYVNFEGDTIDGVTRVTGMGTAFNNTIPFTAYTVDTHLDADIGTTAQTSGILYKTYNIPFRYGDEIDDISGRNVLYTRMWYNSEGWNQTNSSLSALTKEEYLMGITSQPQIESDVFIDRGATTVLEKHLRLSEVESLEHLENYGNGFYNLIKD